MKFDQNAITSISATFSVRYRDNACSLSYQNVLLNEILDDFKTGSCLSKTRSLGQINKKKTCVTRSKCLSQQHPGCV